MVMKIMENIKRREVTDMKILSNNIVKGVLAAGTLATAMLLTGCGSTKSLAPATVKLSVWCDERNHSLINEIITDFKEEYEGEALFDITVSDESELTCKETVLANPEAAADVFTFADDQLEEMWRAGALLEITENTESIIAANGGEDSGACRAAMREGKLFGYPETAGNGYFLFYNSAYFTEEDIRSLDTILDICAANNKKMVMDFNSGWYIYSFFRGVGLELGCNEDGVTNYCNWNATDTAYKGVDVAEAMLRIAAHKGFKSCNDAQFIEGLKDGSIIAGINGAWNVTYVEPAFGENYAAAMLPCYTVCGDEVQMCSFLGYKLVGVNAYSQNPDWAMKLAEKITSEEYQIKRFEAVGECPSNIYAADSKAVQAAPAIAALSRQSQYGYTQNVANTFWDPSAIFGITIAGGNPDNQDLQTLLDTMVDGITAPPEIYKSGEK